MWEWIANVSAVLRILAFLPILVTCYQVTVGARRRVRIWAREVRTESGQRPSILIVDLLEGKNARQSVEQWKSVEKLKGIPDERVFEVEKHLTPDDMPKLISDVRKTVAQVLAAGTDVVHYFHAGPTGAAGMVGAELANMSRVMVYQHDPRVGTYVNLGPLRCSIGDVRNTQSQRIACSCRYAMA